MRNINGLIQFVPIVLILIFIDVSVIIGQEDDYLIQVFKEHKEKVNTVAFSKSGKYLASGGEDKLLVLRDINNQTSTEFSDNYS